MTSKLGAHVLNGVDGSRRMIEAGCRIVKFVSQYEQVALVTDPSVLIIGREYMEFPFAQDLFKSGLSPSGAAFKFIYDLRNRQGKSQFDVYQSQPRIKFWEGCNEPAFVEHAGMIWYGLFEIERMKIMEGIGLKCVIGNFSTGSPPDELWNDFIPAVRYARDHGHILGLHEYSSPFVWWMTGGFQIQRNPDGSEKHWNDYDKSKLWAGGNGWTTLRYRHSRDQFLTPAGCGNVKIAITEFGLDSVAPVPPGTAAGSWRKNRDDFWNRHDGASDPIDYWRGSERDAERYYAEQLIWYDSEIKNDPQVLGATIFTVGSFGGTWGEFDIAGTRVVDRLCEYIRSQSRVVDAVVHEIPTSESNSEAAMKKIIDVSKHNGVIDWQAVKASGVIGVYIRVVDDDGVSPDPMFAQNWRGAKEAGLSRGFYSLFYGWLDPIATAKTAVRIVREQGDNDLGEWRPALDVEPTAQYQPASVLAQKAKTQLETLEGETGKQPLIYTSRWCWSFIDPNNIQTWASQYALWVANYYWDYQKVGRRVTGWDKFPIGGFKPALPSAWKAFTMWQWAGDDGMQEGIETACDLNVLNGDLDGVNVDEVLGSPIIAEVLGSPLFAELHKTTLSERYMQLKDRLLAWYEEHWD